MVMVKVGMMMMMMMMTMMMVMMTMMMMMMMMVMLTCAWVSLCFLGELRCSALLVTTAADISSSKIVE